MVPKVTTPLTKLIRTTEGILLIAANGVLVIVPLAGSLPWGTSVKYMTILNSIAFVARTVLKGIASFSPLVGAPTFPPGTPPGLEVGTTAASSATTEVLGDLEEGPPLQDKPDDSTLTAEQWRQYRYGGGGPAEVADGAPFPTVDAPHEVQP